MNTVHLFARYETLDQFTNKAIPILVTSLSMSIGVKLFNYCKILETKVDDSALNCSMVAFQFTAIAIYNLCRNRGYVNNSAFIAGSIALPVAATVYEKVCTFKEETKKYINVFQTVFPLLAGLHFHKTAGDWKQVYQL